MLGEQAEVEVPRFLCGFEAEALLDTGPQSLVAFGDGFAEAERTFGFHREANPWGSETRFVPGERRQLVGR
jgi:hypothetical protein